MSKFKPRSPVKPWESNLVFYKKNAKPSHPIPPGYVRVYADIYGYPPKKRDIHGEKIILTVYQDSFKNDEAPKSTYTMDFNITIKSNKTQFAYGGGRTHSEMAEFWDIPKWMLMNTKPRPVADKYGNLLDSQGRVIATKKQQAKWSNAVSSEAEWERIQNPGQPETDEEGNILENKSDAVDLTAEIIMNTIKEELEKLTGKQCNDSES